MAKVSKYGQWKYPGEDTIIPSGDITMKGVPYPVLGIDNLGNTKMMQPGGNYTFPGTAVYEIPMMAYGGDISVPSLKRVKIKSLPKAQSYGTQKDVERSWANSSHNSNMDIVSRGTDNAPFLFGVNTDVIDISNPNRWSWKNAPNLEPVTLDLNDPNYKKYKQWETVYNLDQQYMPWLVNRLNDPSIPISEKSHGPNWLPGSNYNDAESLELSEIYDSRFLEDPSIKNNYDLSLLNDNYHYGDVINESQYDFANAALPIWAVTVDKDSTPRDRKFNYLHQFFEIAPPAIYLKGKDLTPTALPQVDIQPQLQNMAPLADGSKVQRVTINTPQGDMVRVQDPKTKKFIRWENVSGESVDFDNEDVGGASSDFPQIQKSKSRPSFEYGGSLPKAQIGYLGDVTQEESDYWDQSYKKWRGKNLSYRDAYDAATADVNTWRGPSHPNYVYNSSAFLPNEDSGVIFTSQKSKPYRHLEDWPDFNESVFADDFYGNTDDAKKWEKNWYSQRATLPQFKDVAEKRLSLVENIDMQPWSRNNWQNSWAPDAGGYYSWDDTSVNIPQNYFAHPLLYTHERSHWYDYNAPQNNVITSYYKGKPIPLYNEYDQTLRDIIPQEYMIPGGEGATNDVHSKESIYLPFKNTKEWGFKYYYSPTEVRARLNEWRRRNNIDPLKNYSNEEIQQIIDEDIKSGNSINFDLYKTIRGRGDLLKQINDAYVSNDTPNEDEFPKAQTGGLTEEQLLTNRNRVFQDVILDDEMFDEGDFELYLDQAQTGGDLPADYQDFLNYSETAPENRRPDSEWQYGNPRQYDHYGMWDALGKPKTFEEALAKNPHWQPDPYDGMYHGFSTNPDTGVWLKSHIPGESHPGDTGWMEYKDFMLSNDRNWGGKNQNLVYDPDLQRMRYIERKQTGGNPILDMIQKMGYTPKPAEPGVFDQMQKMGILPQPTPTLLDQYHQVMNAFDKPKPKPVRFKVPEDYYTRLMEQENGVNKGLKDGRYYQYTSEEGGNDTIGYGHKLTADDIKTGRYSKGLTKDEAIGLMRNDVEEHLDRTLEQYEAQYGKGSFDKLHPDLKVLALDFVYNGLPITEYPNFFGAANQYSTTKDANAKKQAYEKMLKNYIRNVKKDGVLIPLGERNNYTRSVLDNLK